MVVLIPSTPRHRYEINQRQEELVFSHLRDYELEVGITRCVHLPVPKDIGTVDSYVYVTFPYPKTEAPQILKSTSVPKSLDPGALEMSTEIIYANLRYLLP